MTTIEVTCPKCGEKRNKVKRGIKQLPQQLCRSCARLGLTYNVDSEALSKLHRDRFEANKDYGDLPEWVVDLFGKSYNEVSCYDKVTVKCVCGRNKTLLARSCLPKFGASQRRCRSCLNVERNTGRKLSKSTIEKLKPTFFGKNAKRYIITNPKTEEPILVQGTYELAYALYLLANEIDFQSHPKSLPYLDTEFVQRKYNPDFYIPELGVYIEIKSDYTLSIPGVKEKYAAIKKLGHNLLVLSNSQLEKLGVLCHKNSC